MTQVPGSGRGSRLPLGAQLALAELQAATEDLRAKTARAKAETRMTREEREEFEQAARSGRIGSEMQQLGEKVDAGEDSWEAIWSGRSPNRALFGTFFDRTWAEVAPDVKRQIEQDDDTPQPPPRGA